MTTFGNLRASNVLIQMVDDRDLEVIGNEAATICRLTDADFCLRAIKVDDWFEDLSPWEAPAVFGSARFGTGAERTLERALEYTTDRDRTYYIGGYSLAGLFALWAGCRTDVFRGVAAASPSVWFPRFMDYMRRNPMRAQTVCLSLGDREEKTRNAVMATVGDRIREACELLGRQGIDCTLEWNPGNHFSDPDVRTARAFAWVMNRDRLGNGRGEKAGKTPV